MSQLLYSKGSSETISYKTNKASEKGNVADGKKNNSCYHIQVPYSEKVIVPSRYKTKLCASMKKAEFENLDKSGYWQMTFKDPEIWDQMWTKIAPLYRQVFIHLHFE